MIPRTDDQRAGDSRLDAAIVQRIVGGDRAALAELYDRHANSVYSLACRIVGSNPEAEDVVQDVFVQAWRQADRYDAGRASAVAWLLNITRSRAIDRVRANRSRQQVLDSDAMLQSAPTVGLDQEQAVIGSQRAGFVQVALETLGRSQRQAIELAYFSGLTHSEIAAHLGEPLGTVKTRIRSGLLKLRDVLVGRT